MSVVTKRIFGTALAAVLLLVGVWYAAVLRPETKKLSSAHAAHAAAETKIGDLNGQIAQLRVLLAQVPADTKALAALDQAVTDNPDLPDAIKEINTAGAQSGISVSQLTPSVPATSSTAAKTASAPTEPSVPLAMNATGSYAQVVQFLTLLTKSPRVFTVQTLALSSSGQNVTATIGAKVYYTGQPTP